MESKTKDIYDNLLNTLASISEGSRNQALNEVAFQMYAKARGGWPGFDEGRIADDLANVARSLGLHPNEINATLRSAAKSNGLHAYLDYRSYHPPVDLSRAPVNVPTVKTDYAAHSDSWQIGANKFVGLAYNELRSTAGLQALDYLRGRGIGDDVLDMGEIGLCPDTYKAIWGETEVYAPRSIIIPWISNRSIHFKNDYPAIRYRKAEGGYKWLKGSQGKNLYTLGSGIRPGCTVLLVESELCVLALMSYCGHDLRRFDIIPAATGGTSGGRALRYLASLDRAAGVLVAMDNDGTAGDDAAQWWIDNLRNAVRLRPTLKDPGEMVQAGEDVTSWIMAVGVGG